MSALFNMMQKDRGQRIAAAALLNLDTPYMHKGRKRHDAFDNVGHVAQVYKDVTGQDAGEPAVYRPEWDANAPNEWLTSWLLSFCDQLPLDKAQIGDVIAFRMDNDCTINHCAIKTREDRICHAYWGRACTETFYIPYWQERAVFAYRFKAGAKAQPDLEIME